MVVVYTQVQQGVSVGIQSAHVVNDNNVMCLPHGAEYSVVLKNDNKRRITVDLIIDGKTMGSFLCRGHSNAVIERPTNEPRKFTFYRSGTSEANDSDEHKVTPDNKGAFQATAFFEKEPERPQELSWEEIQGSRMILPGDVHLDPFQGYSGFPEDEPVYRSLSDMTPDKMRQIHRDVKEVQRAMRDNITRTMQKGEYLDSLDDRPVLLSGSANRFVKQKDSGGNLLTRLKNAFKSDVFKSDNKYVAETPPPQEPPKYSPQAYSAGITGLGSHSNQTFTDVPFTRDGDGIYFTFHMACLNEKPAPLVAV